MVKAPHSAYRNAPGFFWKATSCFFLSSQLYQTRWIANGNMYVADRTTMHVTKVKTHRL